jgi:PAS domain-containing protein
MSNITEPQRSEEVRREIEDRFRRLVDVMPVAVYVCDTTGIIQVKGDKFGSESLVPRDENESETACA